MRAEIMQVLKDWGITDALGFRYKLCTAILQVVCDHSDNEFVYNEELNVNVCICSACGKEIHSVAFNFGGRL